MVTVSPHNKKYYDKLVNYYQKQKEQVSRSGCYVIILAGPQGHGKTTLSSYLESRLNEHGHTTLAVSIDNFYYPKNVLDTIIARGNALITSRGLPGTHEITALIQAVKKAKAGKSFAIYNYDKSAYGGKGDRTAEQTQITKPLSFLIIDTWYSDISQCDLDTWISLIKTDPYICSIYDSLKPNKAHMNEILNNAQQYRQLWEQAHNETFLFCENKSLKIVADLRWNQEVDRLKEGREGMSRREIERFVEPYLLVTHAYKELIYNNTRVKYGTTQCLLEITTQYQACNFHIFS